MDDRVTIVVPTLANSARRRHLERAVNSIQNCGIEADPLIVVNGNRFDGATIEAIRRLGVQILQIEDSGVSAARLEGRRHVRTPFFGFLDDDDELLANAGNHRIRYFDDPEISVVVTNGEIANTCGNIDPIIGDEFDTLDMAASILRQNWLLSASAFFRTSVISENYFCSLPDVMEWTVLGFRLALSANIKYSPEITYRINSDAPSRASHSSPYQKMAPQILEELKNSTDRRDLMKIFNRKICAAHHDIAETQLAQRNFSDAWHHHWMSLRRNGFTTYALYTRRLISRQFERRV